MTKSNFSVVIVIIFAAINLTYSFAGSNDEMNEYDIRKIPLVLLKDADVVIRKDITHFEVKDENSAVLKVKYAVTLFRSTKKNYGRKALFYDKFTDIDDLDGAIYDANGEKIRDLSDEDVKDYSAAQGYSLYEDNRVKVAELFYDRFPYTVEYTYTKKYDGYLDWPYWYSRSSIEPVEYTSFEVLIPKDQTLRYWINADSLQPKILNIDDNKSYLWEAKNQLKLSSEVYNDAIEDVAGVVKIAPQNFEIDDYKGDMSSWKSFGLWYYDLYKDRLTLPETAQKEIQSKINQNDSLKTKVVKLYKYMQSKTHYINITLGIGGWQPLEASYVSDHGYGDCKALSNFMVSILNTAKIKAYPVLINHGHEGIPFINEFPSNQFNHVIVCVPFEKDTLWLECTSQTTQPGFLGSGSENRGALMITPNGGVVVKTPVSFADKNVQRKIIDVSLLQWQCFC